MIVPFLSTLGVRFKPFTIGGCKKTKGNEFPVERFVFVHSLLAKFLQKLLFIIRPLLLLGGSGRAETENLMLQLKDGFMKEYRTEEFIILTILHNIKFTS